MALLSDPRSTIEPILLELQEQWKIEILQRLHYEVPAGFYYILRPCQSQNLELLCLDALYDPHGISRYGFPTPALVAGRVKEWWGYRASDTDLALYFLRKRAVKASRFKLNLDTDQLGDLQKILLRANAAELSRKVEQLVGQDGKSIIGTLRAATTLAEAQSAIMQIWRIWGKHRWRSHPIERLHRTGHNFLRLACRLLQPTGVFIVLVGPDGCGKSTIADWLANRLLGVYRRTWRFHWRPGLLPKLSRMRPGAEDAPILAPPREAAYGTLVSLARYLYYLADFVVGFWLVVYLRKAATTLVIGERWYYDVIVNPQRYGFRLPRWFLRLGQWLLPSPDLVFLLTAKPEIINARKPELATEEIDAQIASFRATLARKTRVVEVDTGVGLAETTRQVREAILGETARITQRRLGIEPAWHGFGRRSAPKVWRHRSETAGQALRLYHPASVAGRLAKFAASWAPGPLANLFFFRASPSPAQAAELKQHLRVMQCAMDEPAATASFGTGTPGLHRKMVAQMSVGEAIRAYVKIGAGPTLTELLDTEARAIATIGVAPKAFQSPKIIADVRERDYRYLFLSPPREDARPRPLKPDRLDQLFLRHWASLESSKVPVEEMLVKVPPVPHLQESESRILTDALDFVREYFQADGVRVWPSHGDYAPWNTLRLRDGALYVFDWEYFDEQAPALQDVFHRVFMPARLVEGLSPTQLVRRLLAARQNPVFGPVVEDAAMGEKELPAYAMLYFLEMVRRQGFQDGSLMSFLLACMRLILVKTGFKDYRLRVLLSAYACEPDKGSEPGIGWNWAKQAARFHEVWVLTRANNRAPIETELTRHPNKSLHFSYLDLPHWASFWKRGEKRVHLYYYLWQYAAYKHAKKLHKEIGFDVAHHLTFGNVWLPTFLWRLPVPFIWGPLGGYESTPVPFWKLFSPKCKMMEMIRYLLQFWARHLDPINIIAGKRASSIICRTIDTLSILAYDYPSKVTMMMEYGANKFELEDDTVIENILADNNEINVLMVGRMIYWKAFSLGIHAFKKLSDVNSRVKLHILGSGPEERNMKNLCFALGIDKKVVFHGQVPHREVFAYYKNADIFFHPSLKDGTPTVIFEAMAAGLPVVCFDCTGPGELVTDSCGIKVLPNNPKQAIEDFAAALMLLADDRDLRHYLGQGGRERLQDFLWEKKGDLLRKLYLEAFMSQDKILQNH